MAEAITQAEEHKDLVRRVSFGTYEGTEDIDIIDELVSDDFVLHQIPAVVAPGREFRGPEGLKEHVEMAHSLFSDFSYTFEEMIAEGDIVATRFTQRGVFVETPPGFDVEVTGEEFEGEAMEFDRIEDGKLVESWFIFDGLGLLDHLGIQSVDELLGGQ